LLLDIETKDMLYLDLPFVHYSDNTLFSLPYDMPFLYQTLINKNHIIFNNDNEELDEELEDYEDDEDDIEEEAEGKIIK